MCGYREVTLEVRGEDKGKKEASLLFQAGIYFFKE